MATFVDKIEYWPIEKLIPYARNPRKNDHAVNRVAAAIREFGFKVPIAATSDGQVVDGHLRLKAAKKLELKEIPVVLADDLTPQQIKAFRISANRMQELAEWDKDLLHLEFEELYDWGADLDSTGFNELERAEMFPPEDEETGEGNGEGNGAGSQQKLSLMDKFLAPPFSVLDPEQEYWQGMAKRWEGLNG